MIKNNGINPIYYKSQGDAYKKQGKYEKAIEDYKKAIELDPDCKEVYNNRGNTYINQRKYEKAIEDYKKAIELDPDCKEVYNNRGIAYGKQGKYEEAIKDYTKVIELDPDYKEAYNNRGSAYGQQGKYEEAIKDYEKALELDPDYKDAYNNRGIAYEKQEKYEEAIKDYTKVIELDPDYKEAYNNRGSAYGQQGKYEEAIENYNKAIQLDSRYKLAYKNRILAYQENCESEKVKKDEDTLKLLDVELRDEQFYKYINKININNEQRVQISDLFLSVMKLKDKLLFKEDKQVGHYTKIGNLKYLLKPNKIIKQDNITPRLRLNNVAYMNDPTEGEVFIKLLKKYGDCNKETKELISNLYEDKNQCGRQVLKGKNHTFLASFSNAIDTSLPMWVQYTDNGQGCCLVFESKFFDRKDKNSVSFASNEENEKLSGTDRKETKTINSDENRKYYCLYQIKYVEVNDNNDYILNDTEVSELIEEIVTKIIVFKDDLGSNDTCEIKEIIQNLLDQVRFLFKDKNYEHEKEVRLVKFEDNGDVEYTGDAEGFRVPHVYVNLEKDLEVDEVILGPKVENPIEIANYLYYTNKVDRVSKSKIKYQ